MALAPGAVVGGFVIEARLGGGGMGQVYRAHDPALGRRVAIKVLDPGSIGAEGGLRFLREAQLAARVDGLGGVVRVHARGVERGAPFMVMELVEGRDLEQLLALGAVDGARAAAIVEEVARTLARCHAVGVVHRDLKPANVLVRDADGAALVVDFGVARAVDGDRLTQTGAVIGTPCYMAPEQALDAARAVDPRVDVYALGAILYRALAGRPPPSVVARLSAEVPRPSSVTSAPVDPELEAICLRAMARDPSRRHGSATELALALAAWRAVPRTVATRRRRWRTGLGVAAALAAAALVGVGVQALRRARALARARGLEDAAVAALLRSDVGPVTTLEPGGLREAAQALLELHGPGSAAATTAQRLVACARLLEDGAPDRRQADDPIVRAVDALLVARREGAARALRRLDPRDPDPVTRAVEARLVARLEGRDLVAWGRAARGTAAADVARPRVVAALVEACRAAADPTHGEAATRLAEDLLAAADDPDLAGEALDATAPAWEQRLLEAVRGDDGREQDLLARVRRLVAATRGAAGPGLRRAILRVFGALHARFKVDFTPVTTLRERIVAWDDAVASLDMTIEPSEEHRAFLRTVARNEAAGGLSARFPVACARRGAEADGGWCWDELGMIRLTATEPLRPSRAEPSAAVRLVDLAAETLDALGRPTPSQLALQQFGGFPPALLVSLRAGLERVLEAPRQDLSPRFLAEVHALLAEVNLARARSLRPGDPAQVEAYREARARAILAIGVPVPDGALALNCATVVRDASAALGLGPDEVIPQLTPALEALRVAARHPLPPDRFRDVTLELTVVASQLAELQVTAGRVQDAIEVLRLSFEADPPRAAGERRVSELLEQAREGAAQDALLDAFRDVVTDTALVRRQVERDLARGRRADARALLARAREVTPDASMWDVLEQRLR